jgi:hypothetical protein
MFAVGIERASQEIGCLPQTETCRTSANMIAQCKHWTCQSTGCDVTDKAPDWLGATTAQWIWIYSSQAIVKVMDVGVGAVKFSADDMFLAKTHYVREESLPLWRTHKEQLESTIVVYSDFSLLRQLLFQLESPTLYMKM